MEVAVTKIGRVSAYVLTSFGLILLFVFLRSFEFTGTTELHTLYEVTATLLALMTGCLALIRYYTKQDINFLIIGAGFIGTAFLDGNHGISSSDFFSQYMPSGAVSLIPWGWLSSRFFFSTFFFLSWATWYTHRGRADSIWEKQSFIYGTTAVFTLACFLFFLITPLPTGYTGWGYIHRPAEFIPGLIFLVTLVGYLAKGAWKHNTFEHVLILSLIINLAAQLLFMPTSSQLFDLPFEVAHLLKIISYITVLIGLFINIYSVFKEENHLKQQLKESEAKHRTIAESSHDVIFRFNRERQMTYMNPAAAAFYGCDPDNFAGMTAEDLKLPPGLGFQWNAAIDSVFASGQAHTLNYEVLTGHAPVTIDWKAYPEFDTNGKVESVISVSRDISRFKQREEETRKIRKLESIGLMAGGIAHDFNNILVGLFGNISLAKSCLHSSQEAYQHLDRAELAFKRATNLTKQFLTFAEGGNPVKSLVHLGSMVEEVVQFNLSNTQTTVQFRIEEGLWPIYADEGQIAQVLANLTINASQAMNGAGDLFISMENAVIGQTVNQLDDPGIFVKVVIRDRGTGIAPEHLEKIFDPYFSTKHAGRGLGLATVYSIIRQHKGNIYVKSMPGSGTIFTLLLPAKDEDVQLAAEEPVKSPVNLSRKARILVMDDEQMILEVTCAILAKLGHEVDVASDGEEAIHKYKAALAAGEPYDCLIMDLTIPNGMGGKEAMGHILDLNPHALALVSSGYATDAVMASYTEYGFSGVIPKPFTMNSLRDALTEILGQRGK